MNWLDSLIYSIRSGLAFVLIPFFFACDDPNELGLELSQEGENVELSFIEFDLPYSTVFIDSLRTDDLDDILVGSFQDSIYGQVRAIGYTQYNQDLNSINDLPENFDFFKSMKLILHVEDIKAEDVLTGETMSVHLAQDTLFAEGVYLSNRLTDYDPTPLGQITYDFNPEVDSVLEIPLDSTYGEFLFGRVKRSSLDSLYLDSLLRSLYHYPALVLVPGASNQGLLSIELDADTTGLYLEFESETGVTSFYNFDMVIGTGIDPHYTYIERDKSTSNFSGLVSSYDEINNLPRAYLNPLSGIYPKIALEPFLEFVESNDNIIINSSNLVMDYIDPEVGFVEPVEFIFFFFPKENGRINAPGALGSLAFQNAVLTENSYLSTDGSRNLLQIPADEEQTMFNGNTTFFTQLLSDSYITDSEFLTEELIVMSPQSTGLGQTSILGESIKLRVYYTSLK